ncbi:MAG: hypothetical protein AB8H12_14845 [Lewinella sp.]
MSQPNALHKNKLRQSYLIVGQSQHLGINFTLPEGEHVKWQYTRLSRKELPQYWEIMLEGEDRLFFARFFVNVTKPDRRLIQ